MAKEEQGFPDCMYNARLGKRCVFPTLKHLLIAEKVDPGWSQKPTGDPNNYELIDPPELPTMIFKVEREVGKISIYPSGELSRMPKVDLYELAIDWGYKGAIGDMNRQSFLSLVVKAQEVYLKESEQRDVEEPEEESGETGSSECPEEKIPPTITPEEATKLPTTGEAPKLKSVPIERSTSKK